MTTVTAIAWWSSGASNRALADREDSWGQSIRAGDLVFQDLNCGERCELIRSVTDSPYSHVGVVVEDDGVRMVWEALAPVGPVPLSEWVRRGIDAEVAVYRPRPSLQVLQSSVEEAMEGMAGRSYDGDYQWDEERIYCSELVAKAYAEAGQELIAPHSVDLGRHEERVHMLSGGRLTSETLMVTPADLARSEFFVRVVDELVDSE
ncbi:MAG: YiiX/YebB-like N1pC/P60 family cysteine hydrolase [Polyangiales bacterium]